MTSRDLRSGDPPGRLQVSGERMKLYRKGSLLRDVLGDLWIITGRSRHWKTGPDCYVIVRLRDSFKMKPVYKMVHREYDLVSEA